MIPTFGPNTSPQVFHLLTEAEPFSEFSGGAISRWAANVLRHDPDGIVLAPSADHTWELPSDRVRIVPNLLSYRRLNDFAGRLLRWPIRARMLRCLLVPAMRDLRPNDTVWIHNRPEFAAALAPWLRRRGVRLVLHLHNSHLLQWPDSVIRSIRADRYIFVSHFLEREALERFPRLGVTEVLYNGANASIFFPPEDPRHRAHSPVALFAGRLVPEKGLHVFVEAMRILQARSVALSATVLGGASFGHAESTPYIQDLKRNAPDNLSFRSYVSGRALGEAFRAADIFCMPSCWDEPLGMVVLEAMATGLPVVATHTGGIPEMLAEGGGILVARNSATELADALERLATDTVLRKYLAQQALASFQTSFTWDVVRTNYRRIMNAVQSVEAIPDTKDHCANLSLRQEAECT